MNELYTMKTEIEHRVTIPCKGLSISHEIRMKSGGFQVKSTPNLVKSEEFLLKHLISW